MSPLLPWLTPRRALVAAIAGATLLAWWLRFVQDDAFISFRYAAHLAQGHGLVWNPGEPPVEGVTNFLWTLLMAVPLALGLDPVPVSQLLGTLCCAWALVATARLAARVAPGNGSVLPAVVLVGTNHSFLSWATGGMATMLQTALLTTCAVAALAAREEPRRAERHLAVLALLGAVAGLVRPDSLLPVGVMALFTLAGLLRARPSPALLGRRAAALALPLLLVLVPYAAWKLAYYGTLVPNTWQAKAAELASPRAGLRYILDFAASYGWLPVIAVSIGLARRARLVGTGMLVAVVASWLAYVVRVGGDFMEFRFLVPVLPVAAVLMLAPLGTVPAARVRPLLVAGLVAASVLHGQLFAFRAGIESINDLESHLTETSWDEVGRVLGRAFGDLEPPVTIATTAAGAVPYYSGLRTVDMLGLNDPDIARHGAVLSRHAGHKRVATAEQLRARGVHVVVGHPQVQGRDDPVPAFTVANAGFAMAGLTAELLPPTSRVAAIDLDDERVVLVLLFLPHAEVERVVAEAGWRTWPVAR